MAINPSGIEINFIYIYIEKEKKNRRGRGGEDDSHKICKSHGQMKPSLPYIHFCYMICLLTHSQFVEEKVGN